jgi:hypothetical protein
MTRAKAKAPQGRPAGAVCPPWCSDDHSPKYPVTDHGKSIAAVPGTGNPSQFQPQDDGVKVPAIFVSLAASRGDDAASAVVTIQGPREDGGMSGAEIYLLPSQVKQLREALETAYDDLLEGGSFSFTAVATEAGSD